MPATESWPITSVERKTEEPPIAAPGMKWLEPQTNGKQKTLDALERDW